MNGGGPTVVVTDGGQAPVDSHATPPLWSAAEMIDRLGGDEALARQLVALFLGEYPKLLDALRASVSTGNADSVRRAAHAAKGCIANFVDGGPQATAHAIERLGADGRLEGVAPLVARLEHEVAALVAPMREFERAGPA
jgi:HPt (histidine-containing phosphotransfer) domain-containing protein